MNKIEKLWYNELKGDHNFVLFNDDKLYRLKAKPDSHYRIKRELEKGSIDKQFIALPLSYIKRIEYREEDVNLRIFYAKNSEDEIKISSAKLRKDIFFYLKERTQHLKAEVYQPGLLKRIKRPLIALGVILGIFIYVMSVINGMNSGYTYELNGGRPGIASLVLALAGLGAQVNILIFGLLTFIAGFRIFFNMKDNSEIHRIVYK